MRIFKVFKKARELIRQETELLSSIRAIEKNSLDYRLLQNIVNAAGKTEIDIHLKDGTVIIVKPSIEKDKPMLFRDRYIAAQF